MAVDERRIFIIRSYQGTGHFLRRPCEVGILAGTIGQLHHSDAALVAPRYISRTVDGPAGIALIDMVPHIAGAVRGLPYIIGFLFSVAPALQDQRLVVAARPVPRRE